MADRPIPKDILDDLCSRFIVNVPEEERNDIVRLCFQVEQAHWFFIDFYCTDSPEYKDFQNIKYRDFAYAIFKHVPSLRHHLARLHMILDDWKNYKHAVPTFGAILLDESLSNVLLVQGFSKGASWGFPKGKVNEGEDPVRCAIREVDEETGYSCESLIDPNEFIEHTYNDQVIRLYIVPHVPYRTTFATKTRAEIRSIRWHPITDIPTNRKDLDLQKKVGGGYYLVLPFMRKLHAWIASYPKRGQRSKGRNRSMSASDSLFQKPGILGDAPFVQEFPVSGGSNFARKTITAALEGDRLRESRQHRGSPPVKRGPGGSQTPVRSSSGKRLAAPQSAEPAKAKPSSVGLGKGRNIESSFQKSTPVPGVESLSCMAPAWSTFRFDQRSILKCFDI